MKTIIFCFYLSIQLILSNETGEKFILKHKSSDKKTLNKFKPMPYVEIDPGTDTDGDGVADSPSV